MLKRAIILNTSRMTYQSVKPEIDDRSYNDLNKSVIQSMNHELPGIVVAISLKCCICSLYIMRWQALRDVDIHSGSSSGPLRVPGVTESKINRRH